jgi:hypothetical protein
MTNEERIDLAKKNYKKAGTHEDLRELNDVLYNAGFSFIWFDEGENILIDASFDLIYAVQLELLFINPFYTDLKLKDTWKDAWYNDQLVILQGEDRKRIESHYGQTFPENSIVFQFISLKRDAPNSGIIVAEKLEYKFL